MATCDGPHPCLTGYDIGIESSQIAYSHPDCSIHGADWVPFDNAWSREYVAAHPERWPEGFPDDVRS